MVKEKENRLFVVLTRESFEDFKYHGKRYEIRKCQGNFSEDFVTEGRCVELRKGYRGESMRGSIRDIVIAPTIENIFKNINYNVAEPRAKNLRDAVKSNYDLLGKAEKYIAFMVQIKK